MYFYSIPENTISSRNINEDCVWKITQGDQNLVFANNSSRTLEIRTISEFIAVYTVSLTNFPEPVDSYIWRKLFVYKNEFFCLKTFFCFENLKNGSLVEFNLKRQIEDYVLNQDFEKNDLTKRVTELIKFIPFTKHLLKKTLDVESLLK